MRWSNIGIMVAGSGTGAILIYMIIGGDGVLPTWIGYIGGYISHERESFK